MIPILRTARINAEKHRNLLMCSQEKNSGRETSQASVSYPVRLASYDMSQNTGVNIPVFPTQSLNLVKW